MIKALCEGGGVLPFSSSLPQISADSDTFRGEKQPESGEGGEKKLKKQMWSPEKEGDKE